MKPKKFLKADLGNLNKVDAVGRTALHVMALYGVRHEKLQYYSRVKDVKDEVANLIDTIPSKSLTNAKENILGNGPLDTSLMYRSFAVANKICEKVPMLEIKADLEEEKDDIFTYCASLEYKALFKVLFLHFASQDLLFSKDVDENTTVESYCTFENQTVGNDNLIQYAKEFSAKTILDLFKVPCNHPYNDLRFACAFGTTDNVLFLLENGADVNKLDVDYNTPVNYAVIHGRLDIVEILIKNKADINIPGTRGNSALHYSIEHSHSQMFELLLSKGADINAQNNEDDTPLHVALSSGQPDKAMLLITKGALLNLVNDLKETPLHCAAAGYFNVVPELIAMDETNELINVQNCEGQTALHCLLRSTLEDNGELQQLEEMVHLFVSKGADINLQDSVGDTPLHYATANPMMQEETAEVDAEQLKNYHNSIFTLFLENGANMDIKNTEGNTALDLAIKFNNSEAAILLQQKMGAMIVDDDIQY